MDTKDVRRMLQGISETAQQAAEDAKQKMYAAQQTISEKCDETKLSFALLRVKAEQEEIFVNIGRVVFLQSIGNQMFFEQDITPQQIIDHLTIAAEQKQQEIDQIVQRLEKLSDAKYCPVCKKRCDAQAKFCSECGAKLN